MSGTLDTLTLVLAANYRSGDDFVVEFLGHRFEFSARDFEQVRYIKEASQEMARVYDIVEETNGVMNVFAGQRVVESYLYGAVGYVNPYCNFIPRASIRICD